jgi:hypothetical protein
MLEIAMHPRSVECLLAIFLVTQPGLGARPDPVKTDWSGFRQQVSARNLLNRSVRIKLSTGGEITTTLIRADANGLLVNKTKHTEQWASSRDHALVPREQVTGVRFTGRRGNRGLIGGLVGVGVGVAVPLGVGASHGTEAVYSGLVAVLLAPLFGLAGFLIGHLADEPAPQFVIE